MYRFWNTLTAFGSRSTATKILYLTAEKANKYHDKIIALDKCTAALGQAIEEITDYPAYQKSSQADKEEIKNLIAEALYNFSKNQDTEYREVNYMNKDIVYESNYRKGIQSWWERERTQSSDSFYEAYATNLPDAFQETSLLKELIHQALVNTKFNSLLQVSDFQRIYNDTQQQLLVLLRGLENKLSPLTNTHALSALAEIHKFRNKLVSNDSNYVDLVDSAEQIQATMRESSTWDDRSKTYITALKTGLLVLGLITVITLGVLFGPPAWIVGAVLLAVTSIELFVGSETHSIIHTPEDKVNLLPKFIETTNCYVQGKQVQRMHETPEEREASGKYCLV